MPAEIDYRVTSFVEGDLLVASGVVARRKLAELRIRHLVRTDVEEAIHRHFAVEAVRLQQTLHLRDGIAGDQL